MWIQINSYFFYNNFVYLLFVESGCAVHIKIRREQFHKLCKYPAVSDWNFGSGNFSGKYTFCNRICELWHGVPE